jgi:hypothetical protein
LFVSRDDTAKALNALRSIRKPILTVGESQSFTRAGGVIGFYVEQKQIRFEINPDAGQNLNLTISSRLLGLARIVKGESLEGSPLYIGATKGIALSDLLLIS